jgi:hypothetical protein
MLDSPLYFRKHHLKTRRENHYLHRLRIYLLHLCAKSLDSSHRFGFLAGVTSSGEKMNLMGNRAVRAAALSAVACVGGFFASSASASLVTGFDAYTGKQPPASSTATYYAQQMTLAPSAGYDIYGFAPIGLGWTSIADGAQMMDIQIYTGANLSPTASNALAGATLVNDSGLFPIPAPPTTGEYNYNISYGADYVHLPTTQFDLVISLYNAAGSAPSTDVAGLFTSGAPTIGSDPGFVWTDANSDGVFEGSEQTSSIAGGATANIDALVQVPEPMSMSLLIAAAGLALSRRRARV